MDKLFLTIGAASAFIGVAAGAFGAHGLKGRVPETALATFEVGVRYQMYHALALIAVAWVIGRWPGPHGLVAGWLFVAGTVIFSGSLYGLTLSGARWLGAVTPLGGLSFLAGWIYFIRAVWQSGG
jgi:uncharacterized membrane protein YgdD (TMEM256/DUF423 family)